MNLVAHPYKERRWQIVATVGCILFGIALIANVHPIGDGLWFWYAILLRGGHLLYADMHLPFQPLFVLLTAWMQELLGNGWLASKVLALAQLIAYCVGLLLVSSYIRWKDWQKSILIVAVFALTLGNSFFRFDDYHIASYCFEVYAIYLLLKLLEVVSPPRRLLVIAILGVLSGLSISNRLNDGAALFVACGLSLPFFVKRGRILAPFMFTGVAFLTFFGIIALTGDSIHAWALNSVIRAAAIKGGTGNVLLAPLGFPLAMAVQLLNGKRMMVCLAYLCLIPVVFALAPRYGRRPDGQPWTGRIALVAVFFLLTLPIFFLQALVGIPNTAITILGAWTFFVLGAWVLVRLFRALFASMPLGWHQRELLLLIPFLQLLALTMTSRGLGVTEYPAIALLLLLLPICYPGRIHAKWWKPTFLAVAGLIAVCGLIAKTALPYSWHHFHDRAFFVDRQWYRHPAYGQMYIERDQLHFVQSICDDIDRGGSSGELLSITYSYPNYFCNIIPWHGYVQTWYDTTSKQTIDQLLGELQADPPKWIMYERELDTMRQHEEVFNGGLPLPQRALDRLIMDRISQGQWAVVRREEFEGADWILMKTRP